MFLVAKLLLYLEGVVPLDRKKTLLKTYSLRVHTFQKVLIYSMFTVFLKGKTVRFLGKLNGWYWKLMLTSKRHFPFFNMWLFWGTCCCIFWTNGGVLHRYIYIYLFIYVFRLIYTYPRWMPYSQGSKVSSSNYKLVLTQTCLWYTPVD